MAGPEGDSRVCVVGSVNMDLVVRAARLPAPGETVSGGAYRTYPGGKGANQAVASARMGAHTSFVACIGDDPHGVKVKAALESESLDLSRLMVRPGEATGLGLITVSEGGENMIVVSPGANATMTEADLTGAQDAVITSHVLLLQLEIPGPVIIAAAKLARAAGVAVILNAAPARPLSQELLRNVDVLVVNRVEATTLLGIEPSTDPGRLTLRLPELGPPAILLTLGSQGSILSYRGRPKRVPTPAVKAVDAVAAGDAFCGALAANWRDVAAAAKARGPDEFKLVERAVLLASAAGALATTKPGAIPSLPRRDEVERAAADLRIGT
ncbi:MAG: ribokinase [Phycisphaerae bacterium]|nr:ribokinase [Phycisphaerae bacterium]